MGRKVSSLVRATPQGCNLDTELYEGSQDLVAFSDVIQADGSFQDMQHPEC